MTASARMAESLPSEPPLRAMHPDASRRVRTPRMAELVADRLRHEILSGRMTIVPTLDVLVREHDVGPPAAREALRILETEGLITVRRGKFGGADVHMPTGDRVAYTLSMVLQSKDVALADVGVALRQLEPLCASMGATRPDRSTAIVAPLRRLNRRQTELIGDRQATMQVTDEFHALLVRECGNETLTQMVGALELIWASHAHEVLAADDVEPAPERLWRAAIREHERIVDAIERGDAAEVTDLARRHLDGTHAYMATVETGGRVAASLVHRRL